MSEPPFVASPLRSRALHASQKHVRRTLLGFGALRAATVDAQSQVQPSATPQAAQSPHLKVLKRLTYGLNEADVRYAYAIGTAAYIDEQLRPESITDTDCDARLAPLTTIGMSPFVLATQSSTTVINQLTDATILRAIFSKRQLLERTVEFWSDHFTTNINSVGIHKTAEVRDVYRQHAMGRFLDMLTASAQGAAMLIYLNGQQNSKSAPNQNYAREVMELHTLGVDGGYTQTDIINVAKCFSGWRYNTTTSSQSFGAFTFNSSQHDLTSKLVLGNTIAANGGVSDGLTVLQILAEHPATHTFVSKKLLRWFIGYEPSASLVADTAEAFRQTRGDIREVLKRILTYENLVEVATPLLKRPFHYLVSTLRATKAPMTSMDGMRGTYLPGVGQLPYTWGPPDGFPHDEQYWGQLPLPRWNFAFNLANGAISGAGVDLTGLQGGLTTAAALANRIDMLCFGNEMPVFDKKALVGYLQPDPVTTTRARDAFGLALASPAFQWH